MNKAIWTLALLNWFRSLNYIKCECGCSTTVSANEILLDTYGPVCEYELRCTNCDKMVNYWAYGYLQYPETYTDLIAYKWHRFKSQLLNIKYRFTKPKFTVHKDLPKC